MWPFKTNQSEDKPKETTIDDTSFFIKQIILDHSGGGSITITVRGKSAKHVEHVSKKIEDTFSLSKIDPFAILPTIEQIEQEMKKLDAFKEIFNEFRNGKK